MTMRVWTHIEVVKMIKGIVDQDRRERHRAGYKLGSPGLAKRIAEELDVNIHTVLQIKTRKRHKDVRASEDAPLLDTATVPLERLEEIRQRRIRRGHVEASWKPVKLGAYGKARSYQQIIQKHHRAVQGLSTPDRSPQPRRPSGSRAPTAAPGTDRPPGR